MDIYRFAFAISRISMPIDQFCTLFLGLHLHREKVLPKVLEIITSTKDKMAQYYLMDCFISVCCSLSEFFVPDGVIG
jgi:hypothetical protein